MANKDLDRAYFISFCIEQYKMHVSATGIKVMELFDRYGVTNYLWDNFEVLHTQGHRWLMADIDAYIQGKEGAR